MGDFEKKKQAIWAEAERKYGIDIPTAFQASFEEDLEADINDEGNYLEDLKGLIDGYFERLELLQYFSSRKTKDSVSKKPYPRPFKKRLYLVEFIMGQRIPEAPANLQKKGSLTLTLSKSIDWEQVCKKWNKEHPYDHMDPPMLKAKYYRAIAEEDIQREFINRKYHERAPRIEQLFSNKHVKHLPPVFREKVNRTLLWYQQTLLNLKINELTKRNKGGTE